MPVTYQIDGEIVVMQLVGRYTRDDVLECFHAAVADPSLPEQIDVVFDASRSESIGERNAEDFRATQKAIGRALGSRGRSRFAVVTNTTLQFGMARLATTIADLGGVETYIAQDVREAIRWLERKRSESHSQPPEPEDVGAPEDVGTPEDAGTPEDVGTPEDAGAPEDAGTPRGGAGR